MRRLLVTGCLGVIIGACGDGRPASTTTSGAQAAAAAIEKAPDSGQIDRVGSEDGALEPDGVRDLSFVVRIEGPVSAMYLVTVDDDDTPNGDFQADTLVGATEGPQELGGRPGQRTAGLAVLEDNRLLNAPDGSLAPIGPGPHRILVYAASSPATRPGTKLRLYVQRPDKTVVAGGTVTN